MNLGRTSSHNLSLGMMWWFIGFYIHLDASKFVFIEWNEEKSTVVWDSVKIEQWKSCVGSEFEASVFDTYKKLTLWPQVWRGKFCCNYVFGQNIWAREKTSDNLPRHELRTKHRQWSEQSKTFKIWELTNFAEDEWVIIQPTSTTRQQQGTSQLFEVMQDDMKIIRDQTTNRTSICF